MCSAVDRAKFTIHKTISAPNVSPHGPPPFTASTRGEQRQLALELHTAADAYSSNKCC